MAGWTRVLRFSFAISFIQQSADVVIGKPDFETPDVHGGAGPPPQPTASLLWAASDIVFDHAGNLWVSDGNGRTYSKVCYV